MTQRKCIARIFELKLNTLQRTISMIGAYWPVHKFYIDLEREKFSSLFFAFRCAIFSSSSSASPINARLKMRMSTDTESFAVSYRNFHKDLRWVDRLFLSSLHFIRIFLSLPCKIFVGLNWKFKYCVLKNIVYSVITALIQQIDRHFNSIYRLKQITNNEKSIQQLTMAIKLFCKNVLINRWNKF